MKKIYTKEDTQNKTVVITKQKNDVRRWIEPSSTNQMKIDRKVIEFIQENEFNTNDNLERDQKVLRPNKEVNIQHLLSELQSTKVKQNNQKVNYNKPAYSKRKNMIKYKHNTIQH